MAICSPSLAFHLGLPQSTWYWMTLNSHFTLNSDFAQIRLFCVDFENNRVKANKDRPILSAAKICGLRCRFSVLSVAVSSESSKKSPSYIIYHISYIIIYHIISHHIIIICRYVVLRRFCADPKINFVRIWIANFTFVTIGHFRSWSFWTFCRWIALLFYFVFCVIKSS